VLEQVLWALAQQALHLGWQKLQIWIMLELALWAVDFTTVS